MVTGTQIELASGLSNKIIDVSYFRPVDSRCNCSHLHKEVVAMLQASPAVYVSIAIRGTKESPGRTWGLRVCSFYSVFSGGSQIILMKQI